MRIPILMILTIIICSCGKNSKDYNALKEQIELGLDKDQEIRKKFMDKYQETGNIDLELNRRMGQIDSINQIYAFRFLDIYGYPKYSEDGRKLCEGIFYILQHSNQQNMKKYVDELKEAAFKGEASLTHYALMKDRILMNDGNKQIYGSQLSSYKDKNGHITNNFFVWPIKDPTKVDSLRKAMGFKTTVAEYAKQMNAEYNVDETLPTSN
ncbi:DUF6624 domain-containing protein [Flagellimonas baculiformis]|uniref:DUF6624 domain-containing protein n=1 Tax=Flagellimonas baculiformis TaxID=3067310 RepID=UPI00296E6C97|nr:DUF6624 domain-containing protein [Muricauda sp. D6]